MAEKYKVEYKSVTDKCMCLPPVWGAITTVDDNDRVISREVIGRVEINCPYCGNPWSEHARYKPRPLEIPEK